MAIPVIRIASDDAKAIPRKITFTVAALTKATCPAGKARAWIYDDRQPGLALMVTEAGAKVFYLYRKFEGKPQRYWIGDFPGLSIEQARKIAAAKRVDQANGIDIMAAKREARVKGMNLGELWDWFLENHAKPKKRSWRADEIRYTKHLKNWANRRLRDITKSEVATLYRRVAKETSYPTANRVLSLLSAMFNEYGRENDDTLGNPVRGVKRAEETSRERFLSGDEIQRFFAAVESVADDWKHFFKLCLFTGARRGNVLSMRWAELDLSRNEWNIPGEKFKNGRASTVVLAAPAVEILNARKSNGSEWVFPGKARKSDTGHLMKPERAWGELCEAAELPGVRIHDLRRSLGSWMAAGGASLAVIGKTLGHKTTQATAIYARLDLAPVKAAVDLATAAMLAAHNGQRAAQDARGATKE